MSSSKWLAKWQGPVVVTWQVGDVDYEIEQIFQLNLLKKIWRAAVPLVTMVIERDELGPEVPKSIQSPTLSCDNHLMSAQRVDMPRCSSGLFYLLPGRTKLIQYYIDTCPGVTVCTRPYRLPKHKRKLAQKELPDMLEKGITEESSSAWWLRRMGPSGSV